MDGVDAQLATRASWRDRVQELLELGAGGVAFRFWWEARLRSGAMVIHDRPPAPLEPAQRPPVKALIDRLPFDRSAAQDVLGRHATPDARRRLVQRADEASRGKILAFGRWSADYGDPPDWCLNPITGRRWAARGHWSRALAGEKDAGDVKLAWEIGRFPHAYHLARAGLVASERAAAFQAALARQVELFHRQNAFAEGIHWASGQEIAFRLMAWLFGLATCGGQGPLAEASGVVVDALHAGATHVERHIDYALHAVYNNHALSEALLLYLAGELLPAAREADRWRGQGLHILRDQARRQFYGDGGYIQLSHNYERVALQDLLWATAVRRRAGEAVPLEWREALARGAAFLDAHMNEADGRLPNYGANDGALPSILSTCDYADFRPTLQAASIAGANERLYPPGPWDEEAAWFLGAAALDAPLRGQARRSVSFPQSGFHVLRGQAPDSFGAFRCGTIRDRFSQVDMLHLDVWWRGHNVLADAGSYLYNGPATWHDHFVRTGCHNTVTLDGHDQMVHHRRFKTLYWTRATLQRFQDQPALAMAEGEHRGYERRPGGCVHRRSVVFAKDDLWVVVDHVSGTGRHAARLHWLCGEFPERFDAASAELVLDTPSGPFHVAVKDAYGVPLAADVARGVEDPPRGWLSRYYGEKVPVPSLVAQVVGATPLTFVSVLSGAPAGVSVIEDRWAIAAAGLTLGFRLVDGRPVDVTSRSGQGLQA